jgi:hypothetical protein
LLKYFGDKSSEVSVFTYFAATFAKDYNFWTSGANEGEYCDTSKVYSWCSAGTRLFKRADVAVDWVNATKEPGANERCLVLRAKAAKYGLDFSQCSIKNSVLCEVSWILCIAIILFEKHIEVTQHHILFYST